MSIYALSDLHLSLSDKNKSMDVFGNGWKNYMFRIEKNWNKLITNDDVVIISGDISWAMYINEAVDDFRFIQNLSGLKIITKGNHDYWWEGPSKLQAFLSQHNFDTIKIVQNNAYELEKWVVCGTRGWDDTDEKILSRELIRLELSLKEGAKFNKPIIVSVHYPPRPEVIELMKKYDVKICIYGHLHADGHKLIKEGVVQGIKLVCASADYLKFMPKKICG